MVETNKKRDRRGKAINFEAPELVEPLKEAAERTGVKQAVIIRIALNEKLEEIFKKLDRGEHVSLSL
jgi:hypothetical protein